METHSDNRSSQISAVTYLSIPIYCLPISNINTLALIISSCARKVTHTGSSREIYPIEFSSSTSLISRACASAGAGREAGCSFPLHRLSCRLGMLRHWSPMPPAELPDLPAGPHCSTPLQDLRDTLKYLHSSTVLADRTSFLNASDQHSISRSYISQESFCWERGDNSTEATRSLCFAFASSPYHIYLSVSVKGWQRAGEIPQTPAHLQSSSGGSRAEEP